MPASFNAPILAESAPAGLRANFVSVALLLGFAGLGAWTLLTLNSVAGAIVGGALAVLTGMMPQVARQWERVVVLRLGRYQGLRGPGLFWLIPFVDTISTSASPRMMRARFSRAAWASRDIASWSVVGITMSRISTAWTVMPQGMLR